MTTLPADLEALMPEPFGYVPFPGEFYPPNELDAEVKNDWATVAVFTADQMREAILAATERAAKLCDEQGEYHSDFKNTQAAIGCDGCAAAIRARTGGGQT